MVFNREIGIAVINKQDFVVALENNNLEDIRYIFKTRDKGQVKKFIKDYQPDDEHFTVTSAPQKKGKKAGKILYYATPTEYSKDIKHFKQIVREENKMLESK